MNISDLPFNAPACGDWVEVVDGVFWVRMPLPFDLDHINLYLIKDSDGFCLVDTGIGTEQTKALWKTLFNRHDIKLTRVLVTHMHPDHIGLAGWLTEKFRIPLLMTRLEYFTARAIVSGAQGADNWQDKLFLKRAGFEQAYIDKNTQGKNGLRRVVSPIPLSFTRLTENMKLDIGGNSWHIIIGQGHSPEHACLYCSDLGVLISGDHVLPKISPNIGVYNTEPEADSLALYLQTLPQFLNLPADTVVLPSHKHPIKGLHQRVNELMSHHHKHLDNLSAFCLQKRTLIDCLPVLFERKLNEHNMFFAIAECLSHLNYLMFKNKLKRTEIDGVFFYETQ